MQPFLKLSRAIDAMNTLIGKLTMWLVLAAVLISATNAIVRKAFNIGSNAFLEVQWYLFAAVFMLGAGYAFLRNVHVRIDPFASRDGKATDVPAAELADFLEETDFDGPLIGAAAKGIVVTYAGPRVVHVRGTAIPVHAVNVRWPNGRTATVHLDARSYLEVLRMQRRPVMGRDASMSITSGDYRVVQGIQVPYVMEIMVEGSPAPVRLQIDKVEFNVAIDRGRFRRP